MPFKVALITLISAVLIYFPNLSSAQLAMTSQQKQVPREISNLIESGEVEKLAQTLERTGHKPGAPELILALRAKTRTVWGNAGYPPYREDPLGPSKRLLLAKTLIAAGADLNERYNYLMTAPIHEVQVEEDSDILEYFLDQGARTNAIDFGRPGFPSTRSILAMVLMWKNDVLVTRLLPRILIAGADVAESVGQGQPLLHFITQQGSRQRVKWLLENRANPDVRDSEGRTAIMVAAAANQSDLIDLFLDYGAVPNLTDRGKATALHHGARFPKVVAQLISAKSAVSASDARGDTPLHRVAAATHSAKWRPDLTSEQREEIERKLRLEASQAANLLIKNGADVNVANLSGVTPLHLATSVEVGRALVSSGARLEARNMYGFTALHAALTRQPEVAEWLLTQKVDLSARTGNDEGMLHLAATNRAGRPLIVELIRRGLDVNAKDKNGRTPLHHAVYQRGHRCFVENVSTLLDMGAAPDLEDAGKDSPLIWWARNVRFDYKAACFTVFLEKGANFKNPNGIGVSARNIIENTCWVEPSVLSRLEIADSPNRKRICVASGYGS